MRMLVLANAQRRQHGFTLLEILIALVIVGLLAAVALPSFLDSIRKSRRSEAMTALAQLQQAQERWRSNNSAYTTDLANLGINATTASGYYSISAGQAPGATPQPLNTAYVAMAYGRSGTSQANDKQCRRLAVRLQGGNLSYAGCGSCTEFNAGDFVARHPCWPQ